LHTSHCCDPGVSSGVTLEIELPQTYYMVSDFQCAKGSDEIAKSLSKFIYQRNECYYYISGKKLRYGEKSDNYSFSEFMSKTATSHVPFRKHFEVLTAILWSLHSSWILFCDVP
ncbi:hypothetical protein STEG23_038253, partial [Scotinomys teguina]